MPVNAEKAHSKHRGDSPMEIMSSNAYEKIRVGLEKAEGQQRKVSDVSSDNTACADTACESYLSQS